MPIKEKKVEPTSKSGNSTKPPVSRSKPAVLEIKHCTDCPYFERRRMYTADSWEEAYDWFCKKENGKKIQGYVEWNEAADVKVPDWCPLRG